MKQTQVRGLVLVSSLLAVFACVNVQADETTTVTTTTEQTPSGEVVKETQKTVKIITPTPAAKEVVVAPSGYASCFTVADGWYNGTWVPSHQVCQYENSAEGVVWIEGYWGCNKSTPEGVCSNWEWRKGHWEKKLTVY